MKTINGAALTAVWLCLAACGAATDDETKAKPAVSAAASQTAAVVLTDRPRLSADVEALPRLVGDSPAIVRINADLDRMDAAAVTSAADCAASAGDGPGGGWSRSITRPMTGPGYLTLRQHLESYCGGAYPSNSQVALTYDLATGARVNWTALLPGLNLVQDELDPDFPADYAYSIRSPQLEALYERKRIAEAGDVECRDVWKPKPEDEFGQGFFLWADAAHGGIAVDADYVHAVQACGGTVYLTADDLRAAGAPAGVIEALAAAHTAGNWAPTDKD